jgi:hypothetical protein
LFWPVCTAANRRKPRNLILLRPACNQNQAILLCAASLFGIGILDPEDPSKKTCKMRLTAGIDFSNPP